MAIALNSTRFIIVVSAPLSHREMQNIARLTWMRVNTGKGIAKRVSVQESLYSGVRARTVTGKTTKKCEVQMPKLNLVPAIRQIEQELGKIKARHRAELQPYEDSLKELRKINTACEHCNGKGKVFLRACAEDDGDYYPCAECHGTGEKNAGNADQTSIS